MIQWFKPRTNWPKITLLIMLVLLVLTVADVFGVEWHKLPGWTFPTIVIPLCAIVLVRSFFKMMD
jgi:uncharacterized integral membrane protein